MLSSIQAQRIHCLQLNDQAMIASFNSTTDILIQRGEKLDCSLCVVMTVTTCLIRAKLSEIVILKNKLFMSISLDF